LVILLVILLVIIPFLRSLLNSHHLQFKEAGQGC